ncbi:hypothetical protein HK096_005750, partial [Nowakowskiella sp. JEL0078]
MSFPQGKLWATEAVQNLSALSTTIINSPLSTECIRCAEIFGKSKHTALLCTILIQFHLVEQFSDHIPEHVIARAQGVIVGRLPDGRWSSPAAVSLAGAGYGLQIGASLTDLVFILNTSGALSTFSNNGGLTFGGQFGIALGPSSNTTDFETAINKHGITPVYTYTKTKGLFAGISLEGSGIIARSDLNSKWYGAGVRPKDMLKGVLPPPEDADSLYRALVGMKPAVLPRHREFRRNESHTYLAHQQTNSHNDLPSYSSVAPAILERAEALFDFVPQQPTDLGFKRGDIILIEKKDGDSNSWWFGRIGDKAGQFPGNYCKILPTKDVDAKINVVSDGSTHSASINELLNQKLSTNYEITENSFIPPLPERDVKSTVSSVPPSHQLYNSFVNKAPDTQYLEIPYKNYSNFSLNPEIPISANNLLPETKLTVPQEETKAEVGNVGNLADKVEETVEKIKTDNFMVEALFEFKGNRSEGELSFD